MTPSDGPVGVSGGAPAADGRTVPEEFGRLDDGRVVERHVLSDGAVTVAVLTWGAAVQSVVVPDRDGRRSDVVLGFDDLDSYVAHTAYFGAVVGRYGNRIAGGRFRLDGADFVVPANDGPHALHGGPEGFDRQIWDAHPHLSDGAPAVTLRRTSPDGEMGFRGALTVEVTYRLGDGELSISYAATTDRPTVVNLTNHAYFNLAGAGSGTVEDHAVQIFATSYLPVDPGAIPLGEPEPVAGTPMDFRSAKAVGRDLRVASQQLQGSGGYDHTWVLDRDAGTPPSLAAVVGEPTTGRRLEVWTDQPGVQFYTGNFLDATLVGKGDRIYRQTDGLCLETQHFPDSPNRPSYPSTVLRPGETFSSNTTWRFGTF
jgi:aldose 1-epimerase